MANSLAPECLVSSLALTLCLSLAGTVSAGAPDGPYDFAVGDENEVWVPDGDEILCESDLDGEICMATTGAHTSAWGAVTATGSVTFDFPEFLELEIPLQLTGKMSGTTKKPKATLDFAGEGEGTLHDDDGSDLTVVATGKGKLTCTNPIPHQPAFFCKGRMKLCLIAFGRRSCGSGRIDTRLAALGGPWTLSLLLATDVKNKVTGSGVTTLENGEFESFAVTGKYDPKRDWSSLKLRPPEKGRKDKLDLSNFTDSLDRRTVSFKLAGQTGKLKLVPPPPSP